MKRLIITSGTAILVALASGQVSGQGFEILPPGLGLETVDGNSRTVIRERLQMIYDPSFLLNADIPSDAWITAMSFRNDGGHAGRFDFEHVTVRMEMTQLAADDAVEHLDDNIGSEAVIVYDKPLSWTFQEIPVGEPGGFEGGRIEFDRPFHFNRALGGLLIDFSHGLISPPEFQIDLHQIPHARKFMMANDFQPLMGGSRIGFPSMGRSPVIRLEFEPVPEPSTLSMFIFGSGIVAWYIWRRRGEM